MEKKQAKLWWSLLALGLILIYALLGNAGNLEPSGPPGSTMKTLDEVEPRVAIRASDLPMTITTPGSYYLTEDVDFTDDVNHVITVECNDVTINLMGYIVKGPDSGSTCGVYIDGCDNVEIRNGTIRDFGWPAILDSQEGNNHRVIDIRTFSNGFGIIFTGRGQLVKDCTITASAEEGVYTGYGSTLTGNICYNNGSEGLSIDNGCTVTGNTCHNNGSDGIGGGSGCTIIGNTCYDNSGRGISGGSYSTIIGNTTWDNTGYGIYASNYCLVDQNTAYANSGGNLGTGTGCVLGTNCAP